MGRPKRQWPGEPSEFRGQMRIYWRGAWHHLGPASKPDVWKAEHSRLLAVWAIDPGAPAFRKSDYLVSTLCREYLESADSPPPGEHREKTARVVGLLLQQHLGTTVGEFGPARLRAWQAWLCTLPDETDSGRTRFSRATVVGFVGIVRAIWKWGVATERVAGDRYRDLTTVEGPRHGEARPAEPVEPADPDAVRRTLPFLRSPVRALVLLEWATGARPSELCGMTVGEVRRTGRVHIPGVGATDLDAERVWAYVPEKHKTSHKGKSRFVVFGPAEQEILTPFLDGRGPGEFVFRPKEGIDELRREQRVERLKRGGGAGGNRKKPASEPKRRPGLKYTRQTYYQAVVRACDKAGVERWFPYQLRHLAASEIKALFDVDGVMATLGHHARSMGERYGGRSFKKAAEIARARQCQETNKPGE